MAEKRKRSRRGGSRKRTLRPERVTDREIEIRLTEMREKLLAQVMARMERRGISRAELAARLGVSRGFVTQLFGNGSNPTMRTVAAIAEALDCDVEFDLKRSRASLPPGMKRLKP